MTVAGSIKRFTGGLWRREGTFILNVATVAALPASPDEDGVFAFVAATQRLYFSVGGVWVVHGSGVPVGTTFTLPKIVVPPGYLYADGSIRNIADEPDLAAFLGTTYGGNGTTTYGLPDYRGRVMVNLDTTQVEFDTIGEASGEKTHVQTTAEVGAHTHADTLAAPAHTHPMPHTHTPSGGGAFIENSGGLGTSAAGTVFNASPTTSQPSSANTSGASATALTGAVTATATATAMSLLQPYRVVYTIIKT